MKELGELKKKALNEKEKERIEKNKIISLNIRSLPKHHKALSNDPLMKAKVIALQETWCGENQTAESLAIPDYNLHLVSRGNGKGVATYFSNEFRIVKEINKDFYQMSKVSSEEFDVVNVYCSRGANRNNFLQDLGNMARGLSPIFIVGDFNLNFFNRLI